MRSGLYPHYESNDQGWRIEDRNYADLRSSILDPPSSLPSHGPDQSSNSIPVLTETPWDALGSIVKERVIVAGRSFIIHRPDQSEHLLDNPSVQASFAADEYLPYWTDLWPAARMLAKVIVREFWTPGTPALEIGCGLGLPGIAALSQGLQVTFADCDATALRFAADNARANNLHSFRLLQLDWRCPPPDLSFPIILASDLAYELRNLAPLATFIKRVLQPGGICLLTDPSRPLAPRLREELNYERLFFTTQVVRAGEPGGQRVKGALYRIRHSSEA